MRGVIKWKLELRHETTRPWDHENRQEGVELFKIQSIHLTMRPWDHENGRQGLENKDLIWDHETTRPREWDRGDQWIIDFNGTWDVMLRLIEFKWDFTMRPWDHHVVSCRLVVGAGTISHLARFSEVFIKLLNELNATEIYLRAVLHHHWQELHDTNLFHLQDLLS